MLKERIERFIARVGLASALLCVCVAAQAHSPSSIKVNVNLKGRAISVDVMHNVARSKTHYIRLVEVKLNGKDVIKERFKSQTNKAQLRTSFKVIKMKTGDSIKVTAYCSKFGSLARIVNVPLK